MSDRLFSPRFFVMCGFTFTVFLSAFQLLPTAPFHIHDLGGSTFASGLFLGFLTYASAFSAPLTGAISDRIGVDRAEAGDGAVPERIEEERQRQDEHAPLNQRSW